MTKDAIKKKLRDLKKREVEMRTEYGARSIPLSALVWDAFFSEKSLKGPRYSVDQLYQMASDERKTVFEEYFFTVTIKHYEEMGLSYSLLYDPSVLSVLGLHVGASPQQVKDRFRSLAHKYHPDKGGDPEIFRTLLEAYEKLK